MIARRIQGLFRIRPGEERTAFPLLALMLVAMAGAAVGANAVESLFFSRIGPHFLPYLFIALGPITFALLIGLGTALSGRPPRSWSAFHYSWRPRFWRRGASWSWICSGSTPFCGW